MKRRSLSTDGPDDYTYISPYAPDAGGEVNGLKTCHWRLGREFLALKRGQKRGKVVVVDSSILTVRGCVVWANCVFGVFPGVGHIQ